MARIGTRLEHSIHALDGYDQWVHWQSRPLKRELEQNEQRMASIEAEKTRLEALLTTPVSPAEMADAGRRLKALADEVTGLEERWLELTSLLEEATSATV